MVAKILPRLSIAVAALAIGSVACIALPPRAIAADGSWGVDANGTWITGANWQSGIIPGSTTSTTSADIATFGFTLTVSRTATVDPNRNVGGITFSSTSAANYVLNGGSLRLSNGGVIQTAAGVTGTSQFSTPITIMGDGGSATFTAGGTAATTALKFGAISGVSGTGNVTTLTLNGDNAASATANSITNGNLLTDGTFGGKLAIVKSGNGTWYFQNSQPFTGGVTLSGGLLTTNNATGFGTGTITFNGGGMGTSDATGRSYAQNVRFTGDGTIGSSAGGSAAMTYTGPVDLGGLMRTLTTIQQAIFSGTVAGNGGITKTGANSLTLSGSNTFAGGLTLSNGTLLIGNDYALGSGALTISGGTLNTSGGARIVQTNNAQAWNGSFTFTGSNDLDLGTGPVTLGTTGTVTVSGSTLTVGGGISGAGFGFTKAGAGSLVVNGSSSFTGPVVVSAGTLQVNGDIFGGTSSMAVSAGATLLLNGSNSYSGGSTVSGATGILQYGNVNALGTGTVAMSIANATLRAGVSGTFSNDILVGNLASGGSVITLDNNGYSQTFAGVISGTGNAGVKVQGSGTTVFAGNNTYTGVLNVTAGSRLLVLGTSSLLSGAGAAATIDGVVEYASDANSGIGGQLNGSGTLIMNGSGTFALATTVNSSGTLPIFLSKGVVTFGNNVGNLGGLTFNGGAMASDGATARTGAAAVAVTFTGDGTITTPTQTGAITLNGPVNLGGATRTVTVSTTATLSGAVSNGGLTKSGTGTLVLSGSNSYSGPTTVMAGQLSVSNTFGLGSDTAALNVNGGVLSISSTIGISRSGPITLAGGTIASGTFTNTGSALDARSGAISSVLAGALGLAKTTSGTVALSGGNTFSGGVALSEGQLNLNAAGALGTGTFTITGGVLGNSVGSSVSTNTANVHAWNGDFGFAGPSALTLGSGTVTLGGTRTVTVTSSTLTVGIPINGAAGLGLTKEGGGTLALSGSNGYTGPTTVNEGRLDLVTTSGLYGGNTASWTKENITVGSGGVLSVRTGTANFTAANVTTLLTNLGGAVNNNGLLAGSAIGFDTTVSTGTVGNIIADSTGPGGGAIGLVKHGANTLLLTGSNTYTGTTSITAGTLQIGTAGRIAGPIANAAAILISNTSVTLPGLFTGTGSLTTSGTGTVTLSNAASVLGGPVTIPGGRLELAGGLSGSDTISLGTAALTGTFRYTGSGATTSRAINLSGTSGGGVIEANGSGALVLNGNGSASAGTKTLTLTGTSTAANSIGVITGTGVSVNKTGSGLWRLAGNSSYAGRLTALDGTVVVATGVDIVNRDSPFGKQDSGSINNFPLIGDSSVNASGTVALLAEGVSVARGVFVATSSGSQTVVIGGIGTGTATYTNSSAMRLGRDVTLQASTGGTVVFENEWRDFSDGANPAVAFTIGSPGNAGTVVFSPGGGGLPTSITGINAVAGEARLNGGTDTIGYTTPVSLGSADSPATLDLNGLSQGLASLSFNGNSSVVSSGVAGGTLRLFNNGTSTASVAVSGTGHVISAAMALDDASTFTISAASRLLVNSTIGNGITAGRPLTKSGAGILELAGVSTYTGNTVVSDGTLVVNGSLGGGALSVAAGATLKGSGTIGGPATIAGIHSPGNSPGIETFAGNLTYTSTSSQVIWELWGNTTQNSPVVYDQIVVGGNLDFAAATSLSLVFSGSGSVVDWDDDFWSSDKEWVLYDVTGTTTSSFNLSLFSNPSGWLDGGGQSFADSIRSANGFSVSLAPGSSDVLVRYTVVVPEPSTLALLAIGGAAVSVGLRRRGRAPARCDGPTARPVAGF